METQQRLKQARSKQRRAQQKEQRKASSAKAKKLDFKPYAYAPDSYIQQFLGWQPWGGSADKPGQRELLDAYTLALRQQHERQAYEAGTLLDNQLQYWQPGQVIQNWLRVEAGHGVGKTKCVSGLVNHFFDCFAPSIIYTFAPT